MNPWIEVDGGVGPTNAYKVTCLDFFPCWHLTLTYLMALVFNFNNPELIF